MVETLDRIDRAVGKLQLRMNVVEKDVVILRDKVLDQERNTMLHAEALKKSLKLHELQQEAIGHLKNALTELAKVVREIAVVTAA